MAKQASEAENRGKRTHPGDVRGQAGAAPEKRARRKARVEEKTWS